MKPNTPHSPGHKGPHQPAISLTAWLLTLLIAGAGMLPFTAGPAFAAKSHAKSQVKAATKASTSAKPAEPVAPPAPAATSQPVVGANSLTLALKDLGDANGYTLKTVKTERTYDFTRPTGWAVASSSAIKVTFQHSPSLLPERSSLNVLLNNRILKTIPLGDNNVTPTTLSIPIPVDLLKDHNRVSFQVDQHYTYDCEDPFSTELWTTLLPETGLTLQYAPKAIHPNLAELPYPFFDPLGYGTTRIGYMVPTGALSDETFTALGKAAVFFGQAVSWRPEAPAIRAPGQWRNDENIVVVGTPSENESVGWLGPLPVPLSGGQFSDPVTGKVLPPEVGVILTVRNPQYPDKAVLVISGNGPKGVQAAASVLAQKPTNNLLVGPYALVHDAQKGPDHPARAWDHFVRKSGNALSDLGLETMTARGITALPLFYRLNVMPDLYRPGRTKAKLHTTYSYASQLDEGQSKLEVTLNGKTLKSVPLNNRAGENLASFDLDIPSEELFTFNNLVYQFHMYPDKYDKCRFTTDVHLWGTVHNVTTIEVPGNIKTPLPDVGLLNDGGFPFTLYQDLSDTSVVLPDVPSMSDLSAMVQVLTRLGRESNSKTGINLAVHTAKTLPGDERGSRHLIVVGAPDKNKLTAEIQSKSKLLIQGNQKTLSDAERKKIATLGYASGQGVLEELLSPWNDKRVVLLLTGDSDGALEKLGYLFQEDSQFGALQAGNLAVMNDSGPKSLLMLNVGEAKFALQSDFEQETGLPQWAWWVVGFLALVGALNVLGFVFGRKKR